jgi:hypothetical protein
VVVVINPISANALRHVTTAGHVPGEERAAMVRDLIALGVEFMYRAMSYAELLDCGHHNTHALQDRMQRNYSGGTGYGVDPKTGAKSCYACCADHERAAMIRDGRAALYLVQRAEPKEGARDGVIVRHYITDWAGHLSFRSSFPTKSHGYGFGRRYDIVTGRFVGPDGFVWTYRNAGDNQIARCKRTKERAQ